MNAQYENLAREYENKPEAYYEFSRPGMLPYVPVVSSTILEIGCSSGGFGHLVKTERPGAVVWGIEPDAKSAKIATTRLDHVINGVFEAEMPELKGKLFDAICLNDVLEHMANPEQALADCKTYLAPQGVIVASIPNILFFTQIAKILLFQDWKYEDAGILDRTHLRFFTKKSIIRMFEECGYRILKIEGLNQGFNLKYSLLSILSLGHCTDWRHGQFAVQATPS